MIRASDNKLTPFSLLSRPALGRDDAPGAFVCPPHQQLTRGGDAPGTFSVALRRVLRAGVEAVYRAWTDPVIYRKWSGGRRFICESVQLDVRVGGQMRQTIRDVDTGVRWDFDGEYRDVVPNRKLVFTFHWVSDQGEDHGRSLVTVEFTPRGPAECELAITHVNQPDEKYREGTVQGWTEWMDKLETLLKE